MPVKEVTCNKCNWVHFAVSRKRAEADVKKFNVYFDALTEEKQQQYYKGKKSDISEYEHCSACGNGYTDFHDSQDGDAPYGVTIGPIICEGYDDDDLYDTERST